MTAIISGVYSDGKIELLETPVGIRDGKVRVILIEDTQANPASAQMQYGKYRSGQLSTEADFAVAEWHGEQGWDNGHGQ